MATTSNTPPNTALGKFAAIAGKCAVCGHTLALAQAGAIGATCLKHSSMVTCYKPAPAGVATNPAYIGTSLFCTYAVSLGLTRGQACALFGGDKGMGTLAAPVYQPYVTYTQGGQVRKYLKIGAKAALAALVAASNNK